MAKEATMPTPQDDELQDDLAGAPAPEAAPAPEPAPPPEPKNLREELSAQFDASTGKEEPPTKPKGKEPVAAAPPEGAEVPAAPPPEETERPIPHRLRDPLGKQWDKLPPEVRNAFHEYETNIGRLNNKYGKAAQAWDATQRVYAPYQQMVESEGGNFHGAVEALFETARVLRTGAPEQKVALVQAIMKEFRIPAEQVLGRQAAPGQGGAPAPAPAPAVSPEFVNRLAALEHHILTRNAEETYSIRAQVDETLETFVNDPTRPYVKEPGFLDAMADLIETGRAPDLAAAYETATWMFPRTRQLELAKTNLQGLQGRQQAAVAARRAAVSVPGNAPGAVSRDTSKMNLRETLSAAFDGELE
jgi:hypothetical protein